MTVRFSIPLLRRTSSLRPEGFVDAVLARGRIEGEQIVLEGKAILDLIALFPDPRARRAKSQNGVAPPTPSSTFSITELKAKAETRPEGFIDLILTRGKVDGDLLTLDATTLAELRARFQIHPAKPLMPVGGKYRLTTIKAASVRRPPGYLEFILARGIIDGDVVTLDEPTLREIKDRFPFTQALRLKEPTVVEMAANFSEAMGDWVKAGFVVVRRETYEVRHAICRACEHWDRHARGGLGKCRRCGCSRVKLWLASSTCPLKPAKWGRAIRS